MICHSVAHSCDSPESYNEVIIRHTSNASLHYLVRYWSFKTYRRPIFGCAAAICIPLLIQQNVDGSDFFNRSWEEFKVGFNDSRGNYWLGNELLHRQTYNGRYKLRFDLQARNLSWYYAQYGAFVVYSEAVGYKLVVSVYSGNAGDAFSSHNNMMFTTYDRDNDPWNNPSYKNNCAVYNGGGFWYKTCSHVRVNVVRGRGDDFLWCSAIGNIDLLSSRMWLVC